MTAPPDQTGETGAKSEAAVEAEPAAAAEVGSAKVSGGDSSDSGDSGDSGDGAGAVAAGGRVRRAPPWRELAWLALLRVAMSAGVGAAGIIALSDDDYARVTIAQRFATSARLDPSGTSWLPFPFWTTGLAMKVLDPSLEVARLVASAESIAATWLLYAAGRRWGFSEKRALAAAALATVTPAVALLGGVCVPEFPTAALVFFAMVAVTAAPRAESAVPSADGAVPGAESAVPGAESASRAPSVDRAVLLASAAMFAATLSRYESWPIAVPLAVIVWRRQRAEPLWRRASSALLLLLGPIFWIANNRIAHSDAFAFLRRVASYRAALGPQQPGARWAYFQGLVSGSPAAMVALTLLVVAMLRATDRAAARSHLYRLRAWGTSALALFAFLIAGQAMGGAPTHHPERALLVVWIMATFAAIDLAAFVRPPNWRAIPIVLLLLVDFRNMLADRGARRETEERVGHQLRALVPRGERVFAATTDYGYFALMASFGRPGDVAIDSQDPRAKTTTTLLRDPWNAVVRLRAENATWLVAPSSVVFPLALQERSRDGHLVIYELNPRR